MSPNTIVRDVRQYTQHYLMPATPKKRWPQMQFGLQAYSLQTFQSATGNARRVVANPNTAARKSERLLANEKLATKLGRIFDALKLVKPSSFVNVDHSDMNGLMALVGAAQTRNGRAIPCFVETTYSDRLPGVGRSGMTLRKQALRAARAKERKNIGLTEHTLRALQAFADRLGFWPKLVFDRGFGSKVIIEALVEAEATFYVRLKAGRFIELGDGKAVTRLNVRDLEEEDMTVQLYGMTLRVIRSPKSRRAKEPWYILTNDQASSRNKVLKIYYYRFEIEESFKDIKHILEFRRTRLNKPSSLKVVLWFMVLGIALLYQATKPTKQQHGATHPKKRTSWIRAALEQLHQAYGLVVWGGG